MKFVAKTIFGLEDILAGELKALGAENIQKLTRAVQFEGDMKLLYRANLELRTALRILYPFRTFKTKHESHFYKKMRETDWSKYMQLTDTFAIDGHTQSKYITHSKFLALKAKDAIVDQFRDNTGDRPNVNVKSPTMRLNVHISYENLCTLSWDSSGDSLHKRGYRSVTGEAPINEVLAAGMIFLSGWEKDCAFIDPMCGSGTLLIEAAMIAKNMPPQLNRRGFGFQNWSNYDDKLWRDVVSEAKRNIKDFELPIIGYDIDSESVRIAQNNIMNARLRGDVLVETKDFRNLTTDLEKGMLMMNPPYDERLEIDDINAFYKRIGDQMKKEFSGWNAWIISSNIPALKRVGLKPSRRIALFNGSLECKFYKFEMYRGSKKAKKMEVSE
ncbi:MAG: THUMP domain-containing protein [Bacteroidetes bacterium]|jgi:putative N6-adenine-specific DNA methylase|nr:THUMP domain-containing protein [Bacteroidota bacterium]MDF1864484.1 THUMP domain-containing protein [Saprospiraceae bacterium]